MGRPDDDGALGGSADVVIEGAATTPGADVAAALQRLAPSSGDLFLHGRRLDAAETFGDLGLEEGFLIGRGAPFAPVRIDTPTAGWELRVVGGPMAGTVFHLPEGTYELGRGDVALPLPGDGPLSRRHLSLTLTATEITVTDLESSNGTWVEGCRPAELPRSDHTRCSVPGRRCCRWWLRRLRQLRSSGVRIRWPVRRSEWHRCSAAPTIVERAPARATWRGDGRAER